MVETTRRSGFALLAAGALLIPRLLAAQCPGVLQLEFGARLPYYCNVPVEGDHPGIIRAVVVVHGRGRNAAGAFTAVNQAAIDEGKNAETIILAPHFQQSSPAAGQLSWSSDRWRDGGLSDSQEGGVPRLSSYAVMDLILMQFVDKKRFPDLRHIVLAGHSAGGQFTQRYAATNRLEPSLSPLLVRYIVSNPSSYMYLNRRRWIRKKFRTPGVVRRLLCPSWNNYKYGLRKRHGWVGEPGSDEIRTQYRARRVTYLIGEADTGNGDLDTRCAARLQGPNRLRRGEIFYDFMNEFFPSPTHRLLTVPGVGHNAAGMYQSSQGRSALFD